MLIEAAVAGALLAVLTLVAVRVLAAASLERRRVDQQVIALQEAAGAMQRVTALPWDELTAERLAEVRLSEGAPRALPGAELRWTVEPTEAVPAAKHIHVQLSWQSPNGAPQRPVRLDYWAFAPAGTTTETAEGDAP